MESLGNTQQRAGEKTIKGEVGGAGNTEELSCRQGRAQCGQEWVEGRGMAVETEEEKWSEEQYSWEQRGAGKCRLAEE